MKKSCILLILSIMPLMSQAITIINENSWEIEAYIAFGDTFAAERMANALGMAPEEFSKLYHTFSFSPVFTPDQMDIMKQIAREEGVEHAKTYGYISRYEIDVFNDRTWEFDCDEFCNAISAPHSALNHRLLFPKYKAHFNVRSDLEKVKFTYHTYQTVLLFYSDTKDIMVMNNPDCTITIKNNGFMRGIKAELSPECKS